MLVTMQNALNAIGWPVLCGSPKMERLLEFNVQQIIDYQTVLIHDLVQLHDLNLKLAEIRFS